MQDEGGRMKMKAEGERMNASRKEFIPHPSPLIHHPSSLHMANPDVVCRQESDGAALFNPDTNDLLAINAVGHLIWLALDWPRTQPEIVAHLVSTCQDAPVDQVAADVATFLEMLIPRGFIGLVWEEDSPLPNLAGTEALPTPERPLSHTPTGHQDRRYYQGHSMAGAFRPGDYLTVEPAPLAAIRPGDVVVYQGYSLAGEPADVVHRVVAVTADGLVTRGDNNPQVDNDLVTQDILLGRVTRLERGGRVHRVGTGRAGVFQLWARRAWRLGWRLLRAVGRAAYRWLRESDLVANIWRPTLIPLLLTTSNGTVLVKYVHGRRTVARWRPQTGRFRCRKPYDLVLTSPGRR